LQFILRFCIFNALLLRPHLHYLQVLACIGEQFSEGDEVCGVAVNIRPKGDRIELWTKTASNEAAQVRFLQLDCVSGTAHTSQPPNRFSRLPAHHALVQQQQHCHGLQFAVCEAACFPTVIIL
jgi:hypothetical protein